MDTAGMTKKNKIAVIGTVFMDLKGFANDKYDPAGTNIGEIKFVHGGVGRNAAENLSNIGLDVSFISTVDIGGSGDEVVGYLNSRNIDTTHVLRTKEKGMGMWLAVLDSCGELRGSISQQPDLSLLENFIDGEIDNAIADCSCVVLEIDTTRTIAEKVLEASNKASKPVYAIVGNMSVINANKYMLSQTACFICNNVEAGKLIDEDFTDISTEKLLRVIKEIADKFDIKSLIITNGADGAVYYDKTAGDCGHQPAIKTTVVDSTGAGDAFFSGAVGALSKGFSIGKASEIGAMLASKVIASSSSSVEPCSNIFYKK